MFDLKILNRKKKELKEERLDLSESPEPDAEPPKHNQPHPDSVLGLVKDRLPDAYSDWLKVYNDTTKLHNEIKKVSQSDAMLRLRKSVQVRMANELKDIKKEDGDIWYKEDSFLASGSLEESMQRLGFVFPDFEQAIKSDPDYLLLLIEKTAADRENYDFLGIKNLSGANKNDKKTYADKGRIPVDEIGRYYDEMSVAFQEVRELPGAKADEITKLLSMEDRIIDIKNLVLDIAYTAKDKDYLKTAVRRGFAKFWKEIRDEAAEGLTAKAEEAVKQTERKAKIASLDLDIAQREDNIRRLVSTEETIKLSIKNLEKIAPRSNIPSSDSSEDEDEDASDSTDETEDDDVGVADEPNEEGEDDAEEENEDKAAKKSEDKDIAKALGEKGYVFVKQIGKYVRKAPNKNGTHSCIKKNGEMGGLISDAKYKQLVPPSKEK